MLRNLKNSSCHLNVKNKFAIVRPVRDYGTDDVPCVSSHDDGGFGASNVCVMDCDGDVTEERGRTDDSCEEEIECLRLR